MTDIVDALRDPISMSMFRRKDDMIGYLLAIRGESAAEIERLRLSLSEAIAQRDAAFEMSKCECGTDEACRNLVEARATGRREGMEAMTDALNDDALTKRAADFLFERDQQTTQEERCEGEREASAFIILQMGAAAIRAAMEK